MHRIGVVGISWRHRRADALGTFTIPREERTARVPRLAAALGVRELVYVATCNRVEVAFDIEGATLIAVLRRRIFAELAGREPRAGEAEHALRVWQGEGAAEHLFLMAAGLDSARVGESEVAGQVRAALELSRTLGLVGPRLDRVFGEALKVAKHVRPVTEGRIGKVSLSEIALRHVFERVGRTPGAVALVGVSPMTEQCARALAARGVRVLIVNRTLERAEALADEVGAESRSLDAFRQAPDGVEALVVATGAREPVLARADLERIAARAPSGESPLVVDLGVPANVAPEDAAAADVPRIGMDDISAEAASDHEKVLMEFADARAIVDEALTEMRRETAERLVGSMIAQLRQRYRHTAIEGVERLFERDLAGLGEAERDAIRRWAETLARRFAHLPSVGLRDLVFQVGPGAVETFFSHSEPELAKELREATERTGVGLLDAAVE
jgi:glutamyl-tRNA reductase